MVMSFGSVMSLQLGLCWTAKSVCGDLENIEGGIEAGNWNGLCTEVVGGNTRGSETKVFQVD